MFSMNRFFCSWAFRNLSPPFPLAGAAKIRRWVCVPMCIYRWVFYWYSDMCINSSDIRIALEGGGAGKQHLIFGKEGKGENVAEKYPGERRSPHKHGCCSEPKRTGVFVWNPRRPSNKRGAKTKYLSFIASGRLLFKAKSLFFILVVFCLVSLLTPTLITLLRRLADPEGASLDQVHR